MRCAEHFTGSAELRPVRIAVHVRQMNMTTQEPRKESASALAVIHWEEEVAEALQSLNKRLIQLRDDLLLPLDTLPPKDDHRSKQILGKMRKTETTLRTDLRRILLKGSKLQPASHVKYASEVIQKIALLPKTLMRDVIRPFEAWECRVTCVGGECRVRTEEEFDEAVERIRQILSELISKADSIKVESRRDSQRLRQYQFRDWLETRRNT